MTAGHETHNDRDPLLAAILDEPLTEEERSDAAFLAGHRAAVADVNLLRQQLGLIADVLTEPVNPAPEPVRAHGAASAPVVALLRPRRRLLPLALRAAGVAAAGVLVVSSGWMILEAGRGANDIGASSSAEKSQSGAGSGQAADGSGTPLGDPSYLACARLVAEGDVTDVRPMPGGGDEQRVTLHITRSYKPEKGMTEVDFSVYEDMDPLLAKGDHVLVGLSPGSTSPDSWTVGEADIAPERQALLEALPESRTMTCE